MAIQKTARAKSAETKSLNTMSRRDLAAVVRQLRLLFKGNDLEPKIVKAIGVIDKPLAFEVEVRGTAVIEKQTHVYELTFGVNEKGELHDIVYTSPRINLSLIVHLNSCARTDISAFRVFQRGVDHEIDKNKTLQKRIEQMHRQLEVFTADINNAMSDIDQDAHLLAPKAKEKKK